MRPLRQPAFWLLAAMALSAAFFWRVDHFAPVRDADTITYEHTVLEQHREHDEDIREKGLVLALASTRTSLYPLLLAPVRSIDPQYASMPRIHWALFTLAVLCFWQATAIFSGSRWLALWVALPLAFPTFVPYLNWVTPDAVAASFALTAVAALLLLVKRPSSRLAWIGLALATVCAYHTKPVLLFLVPLLPLLALALRSVIERRKPQSLRRWFLGLAAATVLPLLLFCALRLAVVGRFGLVSITGYNLVGIAVDLLDEELLASLPEEHRPLAGEMLRERRARGRPEAVGPSTPARWWRNQYILNQWFLAEPVTRRVVTAEIAAERRPEMANKPVNLVIDRRMEALALQVLRQRPRHYLRWVGSGFVHGLLELPSCLHWQVRWMFLALLATLPAAWLILWLRRRGDAPRARRGDPVAMAPGVALGGIALVAAGFYLANLALIVLVSWPMDRYLSLATLLLPSALGGTVFVSWAAALRGVGTSSRPLLLRLSGALGRLEAAALVVGALGLVGWWAGDRLLPAGRASWIWTDVAGRTAGHPLAFFAVRDVWLPARPRSARLLIQADREYRLFVNGALVGVNRWLGERRLDSYEVGDLLLEKHNRLAVELRSAGPEGGLLCRLDASLPGRRRRTFVSDGRWTIVPRLGARALRRGYRLAGRSEPVVDSARPRWGLRPAPARPRFRDLLSTPATVLPRRFSRGAGGRQWLGYGAAADGGGPALRKSATFDWGREVSGHLNIAFRQGDAAALIFAGSEPPDPTADRPQALVRASSREIPWIDARPRRLRYAMVVSTVDLDRVWIDAVRPEWAARLLEEEERSGFEPAPSSELRRIFRQIRGDARPNGAHAARPGG